MSRIHKITTTEVLATNRGMNVVILSKDEMGATFLSTLARVSETETRYVGISVNKDRLAAIKNGEMTLREAFERREGVWVDGSAQSPIPHNIDTKVRSGNFPEAYLPPDLRLKPAPTLDISQSLGR